MFRFIALLLIPLHLLGLTETVTLEHQGLQRKYLVHFPDSANGQENLPLVLFLHGAGGNAYLSSKDYGWKEKADKEAFITVFPEATAIDPQLPSQFLLNPNVWNDGLNPKRKNVNDTAFLGKVVEDVSRNYPVDPRRIYVTGFSNGGSMALRASIEAPTLFTATASAMGHLYLPAPLTSKTPPSILYIVGGKDPFNPLEGGEGKSLWGGKTLKPASIDTINTWLSLLNIAPTSAQGSEKNGIKMTHFGPNYKGQEAIFVIIAEQGHEWPGASRQLPEMFTGKNVKNYQATNEIWDFFKSKTSSQSSNPYTTKRCRAGEIARPR